MLVSGSVDLEFEGGRTERMAAGDTMSIPSGMIHNETGCSPDFSALEVVVPAEMQTVAVGAPSI